MQKAEPAYIEAKTGIFCTDAWRWGTICEFNFVKVWNDITEGTLKRSVKRTCLDDS